MAKARKKYTYGKRPWWHWLLFYLVIGAIIYFLLYFFGIINLGRYESSSDIQTQEIQYFE